MLKITEFRVNAIGIRILNQIQCLIIVIALILILDSLLINDALNLIRRKYEKSHQQNRVKPKQKENTSNNGYINGLHLEQFDFNYQL